MQSVSQLVRPFNQLEYARSHTGLIVNRLNTPTPVFVSKIDNQPYCDGRLPWPYIWLDENEGCKLKSAFDDLVSLTGILAPSQLPPWSHSSDLIAFKPHFVFDPVLGSLKLGRKSRRNLTIGRKRWEISEVDSIEGLRAFFELHQLLVKRRGLSHQFDFSEEHFTRLSRLPYFSILGVRDASLWGAMACGAYFGDEFHLLHIVISPEGLVSNASYVLMHEITTHCQRHGIKLFLGGVPNGNHEGLRRFKVRWSNQVLTSWLVCMIIQPEIYQRLAIPDNSFFPAYRQSWA